MARVWNGITKQFEEQVENYTPIILTEEQKSDLYKYLVSQYIADVYPPSREAGLQNDAMAALVMGEPTPATYLDLLQYREDCKDRAYLEVYGVAR